MDAKRVVPVLHVLDGRVVDAGAGQGLPAPWARRLELEGADEVLFVDLGPGPRPWVTEVARTLFIPFLLEAPFGAGEAAAALAAGADRVVIPARDVAALEVPAARVVAVLEAAWSPERGWDGTLDRLRDLAGAGEVLLSAGSHALADLCARIAHLPAPVLLLCPDPALAAEALAHGADGIAYPAALRTPAAFKDLLGSAGVALRR